MEDVDLCISNNKSKRVSHTSMMNLRNLGANDKMAINNYNQFYITSTVSNVL